MIWRSVTLISCGIVGGWLGWMASDREVPVKYRSNEIVTTPKPGDTLRIKHEVWRDKLCRTTVNRLVFDTDGNRYIVADLEFPEGVLPYGPDTFVAPVPISPEAKPGPAVYRAVRWYRCNITHWIWPIRDGPFDYKFTIAEK